MPDKKCSQTLINTHYRKILYPVRTKLMSKRGRFSDKLLDTKLWFIQPKQHYLLYVYMYIVIVGIYIAIDSVFMMKKVLLLFCILYTIFSEFQSMYTRIHQDKQCITYNKHLCWMANICWTDVYIIHNRSIYIVTYMYSRIYLWYVILQANNVIWWKYCMNNKET